ncbi:MAG: hypothetical protein WAO55_08350 [Candidatus Manganitrophaceae bacterium]
MKCRKCGGLIVAEKFLATTKDSLAWNYIGTRCICCGRIEDPLILAHQQEHSLYAFGVRS